MIEFSTNTIAFMTAALENACRQLKKDSPQARALIADRLEECAKAGRITKHALNRAAQDAVDELNAGRPETSGLWARIRGMYGRAFAQ